MAWPVRRVLNWAHFAHCHPPYCGSMSSLWRRSLRAFSSSARSPGRRRVGPKRSVAVEGMRYPVKVQRRMLPIYTGGNPGVGDNLADGMTDGGADSRGWRTAPLIGERFVKSFSTMVGHRPSKPRSSPTTARRSEPRTHIARCRRAINNSYSNRRGSMKIHARVRAPRRRVRRRHDELPARRRVQHARLDRHRSRKSLDRRAGLAGGGTRRPRVGCERRRRRRDDYDEGGMAQHADRLRARRGRDRADLSRQRRHDGRPLRRLSDDARTDRRSGSVR